MEELGRQMSIFSSLRETRGIFLFIKTVVCMNVEKQNRVNPTVFVCLRETRGIFLFMKTVVCMNVEKQNGVNPTVLF